MEAAVVIPRRATRQFQAPGGAFDAMLSVTGRVTAHSALLTLIRMVATSAGDLAIGAGNVVPATSAFKMGIALSTVRDRFLEGTSYRDSLLDVKTCCLGCVYSCRTVTYERAKRMLFDMPYQS
jgi:hypothetical protein